VALGLRTDPYAAHTFAVEIDGLFVAGFAEVSGLGVTTEVSEYREGGLNDRVHLLPGPVGRPGNLVLRRGLTDMDALWAWQQDVVTGKFDRRSGAIVLLRGPLEGWRWTFSDGYPVSWSGPELRGGTATVAIETLEIAHSGLTRAASTGPTPATLLGLVRGIRT
jgi:phage tail-like protein